MGKKIILAVFAAICSLSSFSQLSENFSDGDFTANPAWSGSSADWIVNASSQLQSNNITANSTFYLSTPSTKATPAQWEFFCLLTFNPSGANYADVFLTASDADLTQSATNGYFVRIGNTTDEISLYRKDGASVIEIIDGIDGVLNTSNNSIRIKVIRDPSNQWNLSRDVNASGMISEGVITDATYLTSASFGILIKQSTASFFQRHFFDDIIISDFTPDVTAPLIQTLTATGVSTLDVLFNEPVESASSQSAANYIVSNGLGSPVSAVRNAVNISLVHLTFAGNFPNNTNLQITINGVEDLAANAINNAVGNFSLVAAQPYDVVIDELMADPTPLVGLPDVEWLELKNTTGFNIDLLNWRVGKSTEESGPMPSYILKPDSFVIICTGSAVTAMSVYGAVVGVTSFPTLNNTGDQIFLRSSQGNIVHAVSYTDAWYQNELKKEGGWTLEMIDTRNPCSGFSNWKASTDDRGGTPGSKNSADAVNADETFPRLVRAYATDSLNITLVFDEPLSSVSASAASGYVISDGIGSPLFAVPVAPVFDRVNLRLPAPLSRGRIYTVTVTSITDCVGNSIGATNVARVGLNERTDSFDIVINEILFNPKSDGADYVELYNRSNKILNLQNINIANRNTIGAISSITGLGDENYSFFPGDFVVVTENADVVKRDYVAINPSAFIQVSSTPSFNDDEGDVIILNEQGNIIDEVVYLDDWHFSLIGEDEGVALERIDYNAPSQNAANWHSAASSVNFGTPTYKNSQYRADAGLQGEVKTDPEIFSPDNDGRDDFATINYSFPEPGYVANITVFDAVGRPVRNLQRNALSGIRGYYRWDGLNDKNQKLPAGIYIIYTEIFNLQGKTKRFKNIIVLAKNNN